MSKSSELTDLVRQAEGEVNELQQQAAKAKPAELESTAAKLANAEAKLRIVRGQLNMAQAAERQAEAERQAAKGEKAHAAAVAALQVRREQAGAGFASWASEMQAIDGRLLELWAQYDALQGEVRDLAEAGAALGIDLGQVDMGETPAVVRRLTDRLSPLRHWPNAKRGLG